MASHVFSLTRRMYVHIMVNNETQMDTYLNKIYRFLKMVF